MLRYAIDWASEKLASAFSWIKDMAFGIGFWRSSFGDEEEEHSCHLKMTSLSQNTAKNKGNQPKIHVKDTQEKCQEQLSHQSTTFNRNGSNQMATQDSTRPNMEVQGDTFHSASGQFAVKFIPSIRLRSNFSKSSELRFSEAMTYARAIKAATCADRNLGDGFLKRISFEMKTWKARWGLFSVSITVNYCDESATDLCPTLEFLGRKIREMVVDLFGEAFAVEEKTVRHDLKKSSQIYIAPNLDGKHLHSLKPGAAEVRNEHQDHHERYQPEQDNNMEEEQYLGWEDKLIRRQDYCRKRKLGKANRRRLRLPCTNVPVTKAEIQLMGIKSEPISMNPPTGRRQDERNRSSDVESVGSGSDAKLSGVFDDCDLKTSSKRIKSQRAYSRKFQKKPKLGNGLV